MTIKNNELHTVYEAAREGKLGEVCPQIKHAADAADRAYEALRNHCDTFGYRAPGDDRAENFICDAFQLACEAVEIDWKSLIHLAYLEV
jgi:hypothetical protein